jgi:ubiquinone/menaquinone biosynthesis C-methylase UbiE
MDKPDFTTVTEVTGNRVTKEQIARMYVRYRFALELCENKDVLEVACGSGQGLGYLATKARKVVGGDIDENNLRFACQHYKGRNNIELKILDAQQLLFEDSIFDVVILYEAIYYLPYPEKFIQEARRVLKKGGVLIICSANKDCPGFNQSPYSHNYFSAPELFNLLKDQGFVNIKLYADCPLSNKTIKDKVLSCVKKTAVALHIIPKTMKGKAFLKRIVFGTLVPLPPEIYEGMAEYFPPVTIHDTCPNNEYKVLYALGYKQ